MPNTHMFTFFCNLIGTSNINRTNAKEDSCSFHHDVVKRCKCVVNLGNSQYFYAVPNTTLMFQHNVVI